MARMLVPQGDFELERYPPRAKDLLRPWDAADEYLLSAIAGDHELDFAPPDLRGRTVIVNDSFGALATALSGYRPTSVNDSQLSIEGARRNVTKNHPGDPVEFRSSVEPLPFPVDVVILKVPKTLSLLEHQLHEIRESAHVETVIIAGGMARHIHTSTLDLFEQIIGPTTTSLARKKARLIFSTIDLEREIPPSPWPKSFEPIAGLKVVSYAGVFSSDKLDKGTRVMLDNLPELIAPSHVVDLGCGNGVLGTAILGQGAAGVTFVDQSHLALASARATQEATHPAAANAQFVLGNCGEPLLAGSTDLVLNNPPFHDDHSLSDATAWQMFSDSRRILRPGGELRVVGNRHLGYHAKLKKLFGNCTTIASIGKFVVLSAIKPDQTNSTPPY